MIDKTAGSQRMETLAMDTLQRQQPFQPPVLSVSPNAEEESWVGFFILSSCVLAAIGKGGIAGNSLQDLFSSCSIALVMGTRLGKILLCYRKHILYRWRN